MDRFLKFYTRCCYFYIYRKRTSALLLISPSNISATSKILGDFRFLFSEAEKHPVVYRELSLDSRFSRLKTQTMTRPWPWYERSCIKHHRASACHKQNCLTEIYVNSRAWEGRIPEVTWDGVQLRQNLVGSYDDGNDNGQKRNKLRRAKQQLCTCITLFRTFLCRPPTWYDQSLSRLENGNDKAINFTISVRIRAQSPLFSSNTKIPANWDNREKSLKGCEVYFSKTFSWTSPLSDCKVPKNKRSGEGKETSRIFLLRLALARLSCLPRLA